MNNNKMYEKKTFLLLIVLVCLIFVQLNSITLNLNYNKSENEIFDERVKQLVEKEKESQKPSEYSNNRTGTGETDLDVDLYQSVLDTTPKIFSNLDVSNSFTEPFPKEGDFQNILTNMTINNIYAPNKSLIVEQSHNGQVDLGSVLAFYTSFRVPGDCYLKNLSVCIFTTGETDTFYFDVFGAQQSGSYPKFDTGKDLTGSGVELGQYTNNSVNPFWYNLSSFTPIFLDSDASHTYNRYFFIRVRCDSAHSYWRSDSNGDDTYTWKSSGTSPEPLTDCTLKVGLSPVDNTPSPSEIGLKVNGTAVGDIVDTQGYWNKTTPFTTNSDTVNFNITSEWYGVSCGVLQIKINYTDTMNLKTTSTFNASLQKTNIAWNVTHNGGLNYFDSRIDDYNAINFTIPSNWIISSVKVWNSSNLFSYSNINLGNGYTKVRVLNAGNGTWWYLTANSTNIINSIKTYVDLIETNTVFYLDDVRINATFSNRINQNDGDINMSVYNFESPYYENNSVDLANFNGGTEINIDTWHVQNNVTNYGPLKIQVFWKNESAAGIKESTITIIGNTELLLIGPENESIYQAPFSDFNITVFFNDTGQNKGIDGNSYYKNGTIYGSLNPYGQIGYYNLTIRPCDFAIGENEIIINATKEYYDNKTIEFTFYKVINTNTELVLIGPTNNSYYKSPFTIFNITVFFNDTLQKNGIDGTSYYKNGTIHGQLKPGGSIGYFNLTINPENFNYGLNTIRINATKEYYADETIYFSFHKVIGTQLKPGNSQTLPSVYRGNNQSFVFNYTDIEGKVVNNAVVKSIGSTEGFTYKYYQLGENKNYTLWLNSTYVTYGGTKTLTFNISMSGNETQVFILTINVNLPNANIKFKENVYDLKIGIGKNVTLHFNFTNAQGNPIKTLTTNGNVNVTNLADGQSWNRLDALFPNGGFLLVNHGDGNYTLNISTGGSLAQAIYHLKVNISYYSPNPGPYNNSLVYITFTYGTPVSALVVPGGDDDGGGGGTTVTGFTWGDILIWIIIAACVGGSVAAIVGIKKGVISPKKRERERVLREVTTIFDDAVNLEHLLVIYKDMGTCVFFKSYGLEEIDPQLISGFLTAVSSFGREMDSQEALNEIQYGDKMLLLADGQYIRIALVLDKQASTILRQHLKEFIETFEKMYAKDLPNWKGKIDVFRNTGDLVDNMFHTSIILPHEIKYDLSKAKSLKIPSSREVLKVAQGLVEGSERKFFFVASLLMEAVDKTGRDKAEIFMGIKELTENGVLVPIRIAAIEEKEVSQQELNLIRKRVCELPGLSEVEISTLTSDLAKLNPVEREAYLTSCRERAKIVSAPVKSKSGAKVIGNVKSAKKEINNLKKSAVEKIKKGDITKAIEMYRSASVIATNWDLTKEFEELEDTVRIAQIDGLKELKNILENEARTAEKSKDYKTAVDKYNQASKASSEIFKLGITEMTKEVKRLTKKAKELGKSI